MSYRTFVGGLENFVPRPVFLALYGTVAFLKTFYILYFQYGFLRSAYRWKSVDGSGSPIPWFSYPALDYLKSLDISGMSVFEFGSGYSTLYWNRRAKSVCSAEDNAEWAERVRGMLGEHAACARFAASPSEYVNAISESDYLYDIIVIDGSIRFDCAKTAVPHLRKGGFIILDDSNCHPEAAALLREADLIQVDFSGFGPINSYVKTTSFFFHRNYSPALNKNANSHV